MEVYESLWARFEEKDSNYIEGFCVDAIDGISVHCTLDTRGVGVIHLRMECNWTDSLLYDVFFRGPDDIKKFIESVDSLHYNRTRDRIACCGCASVSYDLLMLMPLSDNVKTSFEDCSVCLEKCKTKTSCGHSVCRQCESQLKQKICPLCRTRYDHWLEDGMED